MIEYVPLCTLTANTNRQFSAAAAAAIAATAAKTGAAPSDCVEGCAATAEGDKAEVICSSCGAGGAPAEARSVCIR